MELRRPAPAAEIWGFSGHHRGSSPSSCEPVRHSQTILYGGTHLNKSLNTFLMFSLTGVHPYPLRKHLEFSKNALCELEFLLEGTRSAG